MASGWLITKDHLATEDMDETGIGYIDSATVERELKSNNGYVFQIYDDDNIKYYSGRIFDTTEQYTEQVLFEPLRWASRNAGATLITFPAQPKWTMEA